MAKSSRNSDGLIVHERHRSCARKPSTGSEVKEESSLTSDRRDFLKVVVMAAAGAALPVGAASLPNPAAGQSTQGIKGEAYTESYRESRRAVYVCPPSRILVNHERSG